MSNRVGLREVDEGPRRLATKGSRKFTSERLIKVQESWLLRVTNGLRKLASEDLGRVHGRPTYRIIGF